MKITLRSIFIFLLLQLTVVPFAGAATAEQDALDAIQERYDKLKTFKAKFVQKSFVQILNRAMESKGEVQIKKPGKMKWVYNAPDPQILISNKNVLWLYVLQDKQVTKIPIENIYSSNTPALFLAGEGKLEDAFYVGKVTKDEKETTVVLIPKQEDHNMDKLTLYADNKNYQIIGSSVYDKLGNKTEIRFTDIEVNLEMPDKDFQFEVPKGVELVDYTTRR